MFAAKLTPESWARFNRGLDTFAREVNWSMEYTSLYAAAWLCRDTMWYTPPFVDGTFQGTTKSAQKAGDAALERDIKRIFKPLDGRANRSGPGILLNELGTAAKFGRMSEFFDAQEKAKSISWSAPVVQKIVNDADPVRAFYKSKNYFSNFDSMELKEITGGLEFDQLRPIHEKQKNTRRGRMRVTKPPTFLGYHLVKSKGILNAYIRERQKMVGRIKSGWYKVMMSLPKAKKKGKQGSVGGLRNISSFIKRHLGSDGYQSTNFTTGNYKVVIGNRIGDTDAVANRVNAPGMAVLKVEQRLDSEWRRIIEGDVRQFNKG